MPDGDEAKAAPRKRPVMVLCRFWTTPFFRARDCSGISFGRQSLSKLTVFACLARKQDKRIARNEREEE
jgi:hypothetical protein